MKKAFPLLKDTFIDFIIYKNYNVFCIEYCLFSDGRTWKEFRDSLEFVSELKYRAKQMNKGALFNSLPEYQIHDKEKFAEMTYYEGEPLHSHMPSELFFAGLDAICYASWELTQLTGKEMGIPLHCILCDMQISGIIHFLYVDFSGRFAERYRQEIADEMITHLKINRANIHPKIRKNARKMINLLLSEKLAITDWQILSGLSRRICEKLKCDDDYFLCPFPEKQAVSEIAIRIHQSLLTFGGRLYLQAKNIHQVEQTALHYAACYQNLYIHFAYGDASHGLDMMLESNQFCLHSGVKKSELRRKEVLKLCQEKTLLILSGFSPESAEDNLWLSQLSCADILFAVDTSFFTSIQDFEDYGSAYLIIQEDENEKKNTPL